MRVWRRLYLWGFNRFEIDMLQRKSYSYSMPVACVIWIRPKPVWRRITLFVAQLQSSSTTEIFHQEVFRILLKMCMSHNFTCKKRANEIYYYSTIRSIHFFIWGEMKASWSFITFNLLRSNSTSVNIKNKIKL